MTLVDNLLVPAPRGVHAAPSLQCLLAHASDPAEARRRSIMNLTSIRTSKFFRIIAEDLSRVVP